jgi:hypothetical protein
LNFSDKSDFLYGRTILSLLKIFKKKKNMNKERLKWVQAFASIGIEGNRILTMSDAEFIEKTQLCRECDLMPIEDEDMARAIAASLDIDIDAPIQREDERKKNDVKKEKEKVKEKEKEKEKEKVTPVKKEKPSNKNSKDRYKRELEKLGPEPETGVKIGFTFQDGKRINRKFAPTTKGQALQTFIAGQDCMFNEDGTPIGFSLHQTIGPILDLNASLRRQGINKSAMFSVVLDD